MLTETVTARSLKIGDAIIDDDGVELRITEIDDDEVALLLTVRTLQANAPHDPIEVEPTGHVELLTGVEPIIVEHDLERIPRDGYNTFRKGTCPICKTHGMHRHTGTEAFFKCQTGGHSFRFFQEKRDGETAREIAAGVNPEVESAVATLRGTAVRLNLIADHAEKSGLRTSGDFVEALMDLDFDLAALNRVREWLDVRRTRLARSEEIFAASNKAGRS